MPVWWCKVCDKVIAPDDLLLGPGGKPYHAACLAIYYSKTAIQTRIERESSRSSRSARILLTTAVGLLIGCVIGILIKPAGGFAFFGALLGSMIGGIVGQQTQ